MSSTTISARAASPLRSPEPRPAPPLSLRANSPASVTPLSSRNVAFALPTARGASGSSSRDAAAATVSRENGVMRASPPYTQKLSAPDSTS